MSPEESNRESPQYFINIHFAEKNMPSASLNL